MFSISIRTGKIVTPCCTIARGSIFETLPEKKNCNNLSIEVSYICLPKRISKTIEDVLRKYQISLDKILSLDYLNSFLDDKNDNLYVMAQKILNGFNQNEVYITNKYSKKLGFFGRFFNVRGISFQIFFPILENEFN